ncbi:MAG: hypothetical protein ABMA26_04900 [Limisphaerales bacterium]
MSAIQGLLKLENVFPSGQTFSFDPKNGNQAYPVQQGDYLPWGGMLSSAPEAGGDLTGQVQGGGTVVVVSFEDVEPTTVEVDWSVVLSVDEYYNDPGFTYTIGIDDGNGGVVGTEIQG